jgi:CheY-like chemotaxis protein
MFNNPRHLHRSRWPDAMMTDFAPVLLAEDDENDVILMRRAFRTVGLPNPLHVVSNGQEAISYLNAEGAYADRRKHPWPCLLVLDLKMPLVDGFDVLAWLQKRRRPKDLRVVIFTSSDLDADQLRAFALGADSFLVKPPGFEELLGIVRHLQQFIAQVPAVPAWLASRPPEARL